MMSFIKKFIPFRIISKEEKAALSDTQHRLEKSLNLFRRYRLDNAADLQHIHEDEHFINAKVSPKSVLIVEPNPYHGEILPSLTQYIQEAGYGVDLLLRHENIKDSPFLLYPAEKMPRLFGIGADMMDYCLTLPKIGAYDFLFYSTYVKAEQPLPSYPFPDFTVQKPKIQTLYLSHYPHDIKENDPNTGFSITGRPGLPLLSPHYFGDTPSAVSETLKFLSVGYYIGADVSIRNMWKAAEIVGALGGSIDIVGAGQIPIPHSLRSHVRTHNRLSFRELYTLVSECHSFLNLFDEKANSQYLHGVTSGLRQLMLGFHKPAVLPEAFGSAFGFQPLHYYPYQNLEQLPQLLQTVAHDRPLYQEKREALALFSQELYKQSADNLKNTLSRLEASYA